MRKLLLPTLLLLSSACSVIPPEAYYNHGSPESLLDQSSEVVNFPLSDGNSVNEMVDWVNQDQPSRAQLNCQQGDGLCNQAEDALNQFGVPVEYTAQADNSVTLVYDRILARDCDNRFIDNSVNPYNLNHPTFGCSNAVNMVQQITDKRQLVSPPLLGYTDGLQTQRTVDAYRVPYDVKAPVVNQNFIPQFEIRTQSQ